MLGGTLQEVLGLSKEQKEQMLAHRHVKLVSLARLVQERRELQARLQARPHTIASGWKESMNLHGILAFINSGSTAGTLENHHASRWCSGHDKIGLLAPLKCMLLPGALQLQNLLTYLGGIMQRTLTCVSAVFFAGVQ